jgi:hypothetical protein
MLLRPEVKLEAAARPIAMLLVPVTTPRPITSRPSAILSDPVVD